MTAFELPFDIAAALAIAREAAQIAREMRGRVPADIKPDNTLVTAADREVEAFFSNRLSQLTPAFSFLGEESGLSGDADAPCWVIDPIDGTTNFVRGIPLWCLSVGAVYRGEAVFGMLAVPQQNELFWAAQGGGAWLEPLFSATSGAAGPGAQRLLAFDSDELMQEDLIACNTTAEEAVNFGGVPCRLRNLGSLAYHLAALARGSLVAAVAQQHKLYDVAAGICICREAGCIVRYLDGEVWSATVSGATEKRALITAPPRIMDILLQKLQWV